MTELKFSSKLALKRSIRLKYPKAGMDQWKATYEDLVKYVGKESTEEILDRQYAEYKKANGLS